MRQLSLGYSPCPNDTYIFDALVHKKISHPYQFTVRLEDVETLNQLAFKNELDITKISYHVLFYLLENYKLLPCGGALGRGCGPLVISRKAQELTKGRIALPGKYTTASLLFQMAFPGDFELVYMPFETIIPAVRLGHVDAGVIIHESRFTYQEAGLVSLMDLGDWWESETGLLIPLGGIIIKNSLDKGLQLEIAGLIRESILYAEEHPNSAKNYIQSHAQEMDEPVIEQHIGLYVNEFSKDMGNLGEQSIGELYRRGCEAGIIPSTFYEQVNQLFI